MVSGGTTSRSSILEKDLAALAHASHSRSRGELSAFFDGVFIGAPIALLAASFRPSLVYLSR
jgi:hypothetical protein